MVKQSVMFPLFYYNNLSFDLYEGELVCQLGANGIEKSTLLCTISTLRLAIKGQILLNEKDIGTYKEKDLSRLLGLVLIIDAPTAFLEY